MDKWQAQDAFWNSFGIPAYDEQTYFDEDTEPAYPHITYQSFGGVLEQSMSISANLWYKSSKWQEIKQKSDEILAEISTGKTMQIDEGYLWFHLSNTPFAQPMDSGSNNENIKRIYLTVQAECLSAR